MIIQIVQITRFLEIARLFRCHFTHISTYRQVKSVSIIQNIQIIKSIWVVQIIKLSQFRSSRLFRSSSRSGSSRTCWMIWPSNKPDWSDLDSKHWMITEIKPDSKLVRYERMPLLAALWNKGNHIYVSKTVSLISNIFFYHHFREI